MQNEFSFSQSKSNHPLTITDEPLPAVMPKSYRNTSQVSDLLHAPIQSHRSPQFHYEKCQNPITQQSVSRQVPQSRDMDNFQKGKMNRITTEHENWLNANKKFSKPYSDCTRYIDNLSQHRALIRRGPFDLPLSKEGLVEGENSGEVKNSRKGSDKGSRQYSLTNNLSRLKSVSYSVNQGSQCEYKSVFRTKKDMIFKSLNNLKNQHLQNMPKASKSINSFDRSLKNTASNYEQLMKQQRNLRVDNVVLKNSANKLIAVDLIKQKLQENSLSTKNNLKKIQQKFRKRPQIKVHSQN